MANDPIPIIREYASSEDGGMRLNGALALGALASLEPNPDEPDPALDALQATSGRDLADLAVSDANERVREAAIQQIASARPAARDAAMELLVTNAANPAKSLLADQALETFVKEGVFVGNGEVARLATRRAERIVAKTLSVRTASERTELSLAIANESAATREAALEKLREKVGQDVDPLPAFEALSTIRDAGVDIGKVPGPYSKAVQLSAKLAAERKRSFGVAAGYLRALILGELAIAIAWFVLWATYVPQTAAGSDARQTDYPTNWIVSAIFCLFVAGFGCLLMAFRCQRGSSYPRSGAGMTAELLYVLCGCAPLVILGITANIQTASQLSIGRVYAGLGLAVPVCVFGSRVLSASISRYRTRSNFGAAAKLIVNLVWSLGSTFLFVRVANCDPIADFKGSEYSHWPTIISSAVLGVLVTYASFFSSIDKQDDHPDRGSTGGGVANSLGLFALLLLSMLVCARAMPYVPSNSNEADPPTIAPGPSVGGTATTGSSTPNSTSGSNTPPPKTPTGPSVSPTKVDLSGDWYGSYGELSDPHVSLTKHPKGRSGVQQYFGTIGGYDLGTHLTLKIALTKQADGTVEFQETSGAGARASHWSLDQAIGKLSADGQSMRGSAQDGKNPSFKWSFERRHTK
jgi:hypothetical protein